jgi:hypothetical protein
MITEDLSKYAKDLAENDAILAKNDEGYPLSFVASHWESFRQAILVDHSEELFMNVEDMLFKLDRQQHRCTCCKRKFIYEKGSDRAPYLVRINRSGIFDYENTRFKCAECAKKPKKIHQDPKDSL